jgi:hypothetical protein
MSTYHVFGAGRAELLGRQKEVDSLRRRWLNQHISIVAPRDYGKTVLLEHMAQLASGEPGFAGVGFWDVRKNPPKDDPAFWRKLYHCLKNQIPASEEHLPKDEKEANAESMLDTFGFLEEEKKRVLLLWDGVDELLLKGGLSDNLWNQLTALADLKSVTLILSSRRRLMDLLPTEEAKGSDFWRRFALVIHLGCFQQQDWPSLIAPLAAKGADLDSGAKKELVNWSGGMPLLTVALLGALAGEVTGKCILTKANVDEVAEKLDARSIDAAWRDLGSELQNEFADVCKKDATGGTPRSELDATLLAELLNRGLVAESGNKYRSAVRLLARHADRVSNPMPKLKGLFGTNDSFLANTQGMLELRLAQVAQLDTELKYHVLQILKSLDHPSTAMELMRGVFDRTATLVLNRDFPDGKLPREWVDEWERDEKLDRADPEQRNREILECRVPKPRANRRWLLKLLVNSNAENRTILRASTFRLMEFVYETGTYGHHACDVGEDIPPSFSISACFAAVELCHHLAEDLSSKAKPAK